MGHHWVGRSHGVSACSAIVRLAVKAVLDWRGTQLQEHSSAGSKRGGLAPVEFQVWNFDHGMNGARGPGPELHRTKKPWSWECGQVGGCTVKWE